MGWPQANLPQLTGTCRQRHRHHDDHQMEAPMSDKRSGKKPKQAHDAKAPLSSGQPIVVSDLTKAVPMKKKSK
jgi:hypothetical protein